MIEPPKEIYIDHNLLDYCWEEKPFKDAIPYILKPRWIPVEDGLPGEDDNPYVKVTYQLSNPEGKIPIRDYVAIARFDKIWYSANGLVLECPRLKVIAWQPIPFDDPYIPPNPEPLS